MALTTMEKIGINLYHEDNNSTADWRIKVGQSDTLAIQLLTQWLPNAPAVRNAAISQANAVIENANSTLQTAKANITQSNYELGVIANLAKTLPPTTGA